MTRKQELLFCIEHGITIKQLYLLYMLRTGEFNSPKSVLQLYVKKIEKFDNEEDVAKLEKLDLIENFNSPGKYMPEMFMLSNKADNILATTDAGEELWNAYPGMFPLGDQKLFIARSGIDSEEFSEFYLKKIDYDMEKHREVMRKLAIYVHLVETGQLNGKKIVDFVKERIWDAISEKDKPAENWGKDV
ncbi:hypothetical protein GOV11_04665 [Candidatus Woesearchaeota archaeon]|nr:hypothetical protein [Candidatus Woesearchaeota archaeon]